MNSVTVRNTCRVCGSSAPPLHSVLNLGEFYLSDFPATTARPSRPKIPLELMRCDQCTLVQLRHTTPPDWMYGDTYWYRSGVNETMVAELRSIVEDAAQWLPIRKEDFVIDTGANDGTLLRQYREVLGEQRPLRIAFEPAKNLYNQLRPHANILFAEYFPPHRFADLRPLTGKCRVATSIAMLYDLEDPNAFVHGIAQIVAPDGLWIVQFQDLLTMLTTGAFDNICHEHLEYYSLFSLSQMLAHNGLVVQDVRPSAINGGSMRVFIQHRGQQGRQTAEARTRVLDQLQREYEAGLGGRHGTPVVFAEFEWKMQQLRKQVRAGIQRVLDNGGTVDAYGASTKGNTLLQYCEIDGTMIRQAIERSQEKWGRYTVGTNIPIVSEEVGRKNPADLWLVPVWQFRDAVLKRESTYLANGGTMLFPLPSAEIVYTPQQAEAV